MAWEYSEKTKQLFMDAVIGKEGTHLGEIEDPDGLGEHGSVACGDALRVSFKVKRHPSDPTKDIITEAKYLTFGCTSAIAASEALCTIVEEGNFTPIEALKIKNCDIVDFLGGLPQQKIHCSVMGAEALEAAVYNWSQKRGVDLESLGIKIREYAADEGRIVCNCFSLSAPYIKQKIIELKLHTIEEITNAIKAGGGCAACHHKPGGLQDLLNEVWGIGKGETEITSMEDTNNTGQMEQKELSPYQFSKKVEQAVENLIRPFLVNDGGNIELVDIKDKAVYCRLQGACAGCPGARQTLKLMVERTLREHVDEEITIIQV